MSTILGIVFINNNVVFGSILEGNPEQYKLIVFGATVVIAIVVGIILSVVARRSASIRQGNVVKSRGQPLQAAISGELHSLLDAGRSPKEVVNELMAIFDEKLEERADLLKGELSQKYGKVLEEKELAVKELNKKYAQVSEEKKQTESIVRSVAEGLVLVNDKGEVILMNPAAEKLLGVNKEDKIGKPLLEDLKDEQLVSLVKESASGDKEIIVTSNNLDTKKILKSSGAVIEDENGKTVGMVTVLSDVTKQRELEQMKSDFLSGVSHELRTPIVAMEKSLEVMFDPSAGSLTENQKQFLNIAKRNMKRLDFLINDLLDVSKLEANKMKMNFELSSLEKAIEETCQTLDSWAKTKGILIQKRFQGGGLPKINFDQQRIIQVLNNLIGNAIKFTPQNGMVTVEAKESDEQSIKVSIIDTGIGITKEDISKLFNKFHQIGEKNPSDVSGTGLGLVIAKEIVKLHKGDIWVESEKGKGSRFIFTIPKTLEQTNSGG